MGPKLGSGASLQLHHKINLLKPLKFFSKNAILSRYLIVQLPILKIGHE